MKILVYTAITGGKDTLKENQCTTGADFVAYLETPVESKVWTVKKALRREFDTNRNAKPYKVMLPPEYPEYDYSLWIDGSIELKVPVQTLIDMYLKDTDIAMFRHPLRDCAYEEAITCITCDLDDPLIIKEQVLRYKEDKFPEHYGLSECTIILRRHTKKIIEFCDFWWKEVDRGSRRDQISFDYSRWKLNIPVTYMEGSVQKLDNHLTMVGNEYFNFTKHKI